jgi:hypothetical protein
VARRGESETDNDNVAWTAVLLLENREAVPLGAKVQCASYRELQLFAEMFGWSSPADSHPHERLQSHPAQVFRTGTDGAVTIQINRDGLRVRCYAHSCGG